MTTDNPTDNPSIEIWPFQRELIEQIRGALKKGPRVCCQLPTGGGKTIIATDIMRTVVPKGIRVLFVVHRTELVEQAARTMAQIGIIPTFITAGARFRLGITPVQVATVQTLYSRVKKMERLSAPPPKIDMVFWDEAHHLAAPTWKYLSKTMRRWNPKMIEIGLTATPRRPDGKGLSDNFDNLVCGPTVRQLISDGYLSDFNLISTPTNMAAMRESIKVKKDGEFDDKDQAMKINARLNIVAGETIALYKKYLDGKKTIFFGADVQHSKDTAKMFRAAGIRAHHIDGTTDLLMRRRIIREFRDGTLMVLCNHGIVNEGFDAPTAVGVIVARYTGSEIFWMQCIGRALRYLPGKIAIIIDQAANWQNPDLGMPDKERNWTLTGKAGKTSKKEGKAVAARMRTCAKCNIIHRMTAIICRRCGEPLVMAAKVFSMDLEMQEIRSADGKTAAMKISDLPQMPKKESMPRNVLNTKISLLYKDADGDKIKIYDGLQKLAKENGYKPGWAKRQYEFYIRRRDGGGK